MKRSQMKLRIRNKLIKQKHLFETYRKGDYSFKLLVDNLCSRILTEIEKSGMLPPNDGKKRAIKETSVECVINAMKCHEWEDEDKDNPYINFFI